MQGVEKIHISLRCGAKTNGLKGVRIKGHGYLYALPESLLIIKRRLITKFKVNNVFERFSMQVAHVILAEKTHHIRWIRDG